VCVGALRADVSAELPDLGQKLGLCRVVALLFAGPLAAQSQPGLGQTQDLVPLRDGHLQILRNPFLAGELRHNLEEEKEGHQGHQGQPRFTKHPSK